MNLASAVGWHHSEELSSRKAEEKNQKFVSVPTKTEPSSHTPDSLSSISKTGGKRST